jgi:hypothetical protein
MKRTPGPWNYRETPKDGSHLHNSHWIDSEKGKPIADVKEYYEGEGLSNARLIAAAPELLEACRGLVAEINLSKLNIRKDFSLINAHAYAMKIISEAEGRG